MGISGLDIVILSSMFVFFLFMRLYYLLLQTLQSLVISVLTPWLSSDSVLCWSIYMIAVTSIGAILIDTPKPIRICLILFYLFSIKS